MSFLTWFRSISRDGVTGCGTWSHQVRLELPVMTIVPEPSRGMRLPCKQRSYTSCHPQTPFPNPVLHQTSLMERQQGVRLCISGHRCMIYRFTRKYSAYSFTRNVFIHLFNVFKIFPVMNKYLMCVVSTHVLHMYETNKGMKICLPFLIYSCSK